MASVLVDGSSRTGTVADTVFLAAFATDDLDATARRPSAPMVDAFSILRRLVRRASSMMLLLSGS